MYTFKSPDEAREALRVALEYLVDVDGYSHHEIEELCLSEIDLVFSE